MNPVSLAFVDDHNTYRIGVTSIIHEFGNYTVSLQACNGKDFIEKLSATATLPDMVLLDICMKGMDGYQTAQWLQEHHPQMKIIVLSLALLHYCPADFSSTEIAAKMKLSKKQTDHLFDKLFEKTGKRNRYSLAALAVKMGLSAPRKTAVN